MGLFHKFLDRVSKSLVRLSSLSPFEAHCHLGHPSLQSLKKLCLEYSNLSSLNCDSCEFAKHKRVHLSPRANKRVASPFELVHSDIWGPCPITSKSGFKYFVTFVDDYSRVTWLYLMKNRSEDTQPNITKLDPKSLKRVFLGFSCIQKGYRCYSPQLHCYLVSRDVTFHEDLPYFPVTTYRHQEENDDMLVYVSPTLVETTKQSAELDGPPLKLKDAPINAPNDVSNGVPISSPNEAYGKSDAPSDMPSGSDSPPPSPAPEIDLPNALRKGKRTCRYPIYTFVSYDGLSTSSRAFFANLNISWRAAMIEEMNALDHNSTWALVDLPNVKNSFLRRDLEEEVYMELPSGFVAQGEYGRVCKLKKALYGLKIILSVLGCILLVVYVDDIVITGSDKAEIKKLKSFIDLLDDAGQIEAKSCDEPIIPKLKLRSEDGRLLHNPEKYRRVVGKLNYLTITHPDIAFPVSVVSQFLTAPRTSHWDVVTQILGYLKGTPGLGILYANHGHHIAEGFTYSDYAGCPNTSRSTTGYCVFVGGNLVSWKSKKQNVMSISSLEAEYRAMAQTTCELVWLRNLLGEIGFPQSKPMKIWRDNQAAIYISTNLVFHERTKHIEVDCHFTHEKLEDGTITTPHIRTESQLADVLTKALPRTRINSICNKLGMINIYAQLEGEC
ncbi:retrovirus-related pol polyprotein from transposon RE2 [Tanacetum coccineum]